MLFLVFRSLCLCALSCLSVGLCELCNLAAAVQCERVFLYAECVVCDGVVYCGVGGRVEDEGVSGGGE